MHRDTLDYRAGDMNLYAYVSGRPTDLVDPLGFAPPGGEIPDSAWESWLNRIRDEIKRLEAARTEIINDPSWELPPNWPDRQQAEANLRHNTRLLNEARSVLEKSEVEFLRKLLREPAQPKQVSPATSRVPRWQGGPGNCLRPQDPFDKYRAPVRIFQGLEQAAGGGAVAVHFAPGIVEGLANCHRDPSATIYAGGCTFATVVGASNALYGIGFVLGEGTAGTALTSAATTLGTAAAPATLLVLTGGASVYTGYQLDRQSGGATSTGAAILTCWSYDTALNVTYRWLPWTDAKVNWDLTNTCRQR